MIFELTEDEGLDENSLSSRYFSRRLITMRHSPVSVTFWNLTCKPTTHKKTLRVMRGPIRREWDETTLLLHSKEYLVLR